MDKRSSRRRWIALVVVCMAMTMNVLDQTIVNVALPTIQSSLHFTQSNLAWVIDAYLITFGGALLIAGRFGDLFGRKKTFLGGVTVFTVSSALCGLAPGQGLLVAARFTQGAGAAFSASVILAIIVAEFPDPDERTRAMNAYILVSVGGGSLGFLIGGALTQALSWHWIFFINVPIGIATLIAGVFLLDENEGLGIREGLDVGGAVLSTGGLMLFVYAIVTSTQYGWDSAHALGLAGAALVILAAFGFLQTRLAAPMMPIRVLRSKGLGSTSLTRALIVVGMYGTFFLGDLWIQKVHGFNAIQTGLAFLPQTLSVTVMSLWINARLMRRIGPKLSAMLGCGVILVGLALFALVGPRSAYFPLVFFALLLIGTGASISFTPMMTMGLANIPAADAGLGSGVINVSQQVSAAVAVAVLGVVASDRTQSLLDHGTSANHALASGYHLGFVVSLCCVAVGALYCAAAVPATEVSGDAGLAPVVESVDI